MQVSEFFFGILNFVTKHGRGLPACSYHMVEQGYVNAKGAAETIMPWLFRTPVRRTFYGAQDS